MNISLALVLAAIAGLVAAMLPRRKVAGVAQPYRPRIGLGLTVFLVGCVAYALHVFVELNWTHRSDLPKEEALRTAYGLFESESQVVRAQAAREFDRGHDFVLAETTAQEVDRFVREGLYSSKDFEAHKAKSQGWMTPRWWPSKPCEGGVTYYKSSTGRPKEGQFPVINWCPAQKRAYIQSVVYD